MNISELLIPELRTETKLNETFLRSVPQDKLDWAPHEKSMPMGLLCSHLVEIYTWISTTMDVDVLDMANYLPLRENTIEALLTKLSELAPAAEKSLNKDNDVYWQPWTMKHDEKVLMEMPRYTALRSLVLGQFPHHRAQLGVYLRLLDIPVPSTYGPSADA